MSLLLNRRTAADVQTRRGSTNASMPTQGSARHPTVQARAAADRERQPRAPFRGHRPAGHSASARPAARDSDAPPTGRSPLPRLPSLGARHADGVRRGRSRRQADAGRRAARRHRGQDGAPFVGPAGRLLDEALAEIGIDRRETYVTNAVKHFSGHRAARAASTARRQRRRSQRAALARRRDRRGTTGGDRLPGRHCGASADRPRFPRHHRPR